MPRWLSLKSSEVRARQGPGLNYPILWEYRAAGLPVQVVAETTERHRPPRLGVHVTGVGEDHVETTRKADGTKNVYPARTTLWTTGVEAVPFATTLARSLGVEQDRGGLAGGAGLR